MKIKRYFAADLRQAIQLVRDEQGPDAVILSNRRVEGGVEIVAAIDYDELAVSRMTGVEPSPRRAPPEIPEPALPVDDEPEPVDDPPVGKRHREKKQIIWSQDPSIVAMRKEIETVRSMLETQLSGLAWNELKQQHPLRAKLLERLLALGLSPALCRELADQIRYENDLEHNWRQALGMLARRLPVTDDDILNEGGIVALVGPTGVGKTTTVAKLAARYSLRHGPRRVALITTDGYRIGAHQQLRTYGQILGAPVHVANDTDELRSVLESLSEKSLILVDTAGMSQRDVRLAEQLTMLNTGLHKIRTYAVLSATTQRVALEEIIGTLKNATLDGCILTKLDETTGLGEALSVINEHQIPVAYVSDGQRVPEDLQPARANNLVARSVALLRKNGEIPIEEMMAFAFGPLVSNGND